MSKHPQFVGLDIGSSGLRGAELGYDAKHARYTVKRVASVELPPFAIVNGEVRNAEDLVRGVKQLWRKGRFGTRKVAFSLADPSIIMRMADLPWMPDQDLKQALRYQVSEVLPVDISTVELDFVPLSEYSSADQHGQSLEMVRMLLVAANRRHLSDVAELLIKARLEPVVADTSAFALIRAACGGIVQATPGYHALVDVGASMVSVIVHAGGSPAFVRSMPNAGTDAVVSALMEQLHIDETNAKTLMIETGLNGPPPIVAPIAESSIFGAIAAGQSNALDPSTKSAMAVINPWATALVSSVRDSLDYFHSTIAGEERVTAIQLAGRASSLNGLAERVNTELRIPVDYVRPFDGTDQAKRVRGSDERSYAVAIGLAMGQ